MVAGAVRDELGVVPFVAREREREKERAFGLAMYST
jgi:hypothetical protein